MHQIALGAPSGQDPVASRAVAPSAAPQHSPAVAPLPAPGAEALALQARLGRRGMRLADIRTAADRVGLLNALARGLVQLTLDGAGDAIAVRTT